MKDPGKPYCDGIRAGALGQHHMSATNPEPARSATTRFIRYELKVVLSKPEAERVQAWAAERLSPDPFGDEAGVYEVRTLYLDSPQMEIYHRLGEDRGTKFRVRRYGEEGQVWLERKRRRGDRVKKRRARWPLGELSRLLSGSGAPAEWAGSFQNAVCNRDLAPVLLVVYPRSAFAGEDSARLTLDWGVKVWRMGPDDDPFDPPGDPVEVTDDVILELKYDGTMPPVFDELLKMLDRDTSGFSKYGRGVEAAGLGVGGQQSTQA